MIKAWKVNLLVSLLCFVILVFFVYSYTLLPNSPLLMLLFPFVPIVGFFLLFIFAIGAITFIAGIMGMLKGK